MIDVTVVWAVVAGALVVVALAVVILAIAMTRLAGDARKLVASSDRIVGIIEQELPATLRHIGVVSANLERVSSQIDPRLARVDELLDESEATLAVLRSSLEATEEIIRGPLDALNNARKAVKSVGDGIASGADRLLRRAKSAAGGEGSES
jgi:ABC-type transporter Mla subunit MlaD